MRDASAYRMLDFGSGFPREFFHLNVSDSCPITRTSREVEHGHGAFSEYNGQATLMVWLQSRVIRIAVAYSKTQYYVVRGVPRGGTYEMGKTFEDYLNLKYPQKRKTFASSRFFAQPRDKLFSSLNEGTANIAAAGLTVTPESQKLADFSEPIGGGMSQIAVTGPTSPSQWYSH